MADEINLPIWVPILIILNLIVSIVTLGFVIYGDGFRVSKQYARLRWQGNPYFDFPIIRAPTVKFPNF